MSRASYREYLIEKKRLVSDYIRQGKTWQELMEDKFELGIASDAIEFVSNIPTTILERQPDGFELKALGYELEFDPRRALAVDFRIEFLRQEAIRDAKRGKRPWRKWMVFDEDDFREV
jgi:hypothetical protein